MQNIKITPAGDSALLIEFGNTINEGINRRIKTVVQLMRDRNVEGIVDIIPTFCSLLINYDPMVISYDDLREKMQELAQMNVAAGAVRKKVYEIPVCYGGEFGPDMKNIMDNSGLTEEEVIRIHSSCDYLIYMLGFLPGFCYLGGLDERIHTPRLKTPRLAIPAGSVGIGGSQTGIYPLDSPGGWQLMGKTPVKTYDPNREDPILVQAGEYIRFVPIDIDEYNRIKELVDKDAYQVTIREEEI